MPGVLCPSRVAGVAASVTSLLVVGPVAAETAYGAHSASSSGLLVYHPGHLAVHVTRLHRYDHSGLDAMMEEEARWSRGDFSPRPRRRHSNHSAGAGGTGRSFLRVSQRQASALTSHQRQALLQLSEQNSISAATRPRAHGQHRVFQYHNRLKYVPSERPAVTRLDSLDSQYVGPIGVGTVTYPENCQAQTGESLIFLDSTQDDISKSGSELQACQVLNQAKIWVVFDTGSTNLWVSSDLCTEGACARQGRSRYNHMQSSTYANPEHGVYLNIEFGTGKIKGPQGIDDFHVGPFTVYHQTFGLIQKQEGKVFDEVPFEGILGLAFPSMSANGVKAFFDNIIEQKALQNNEFSFYFSLDNPASNAILWGGVDPHFYEGPIEYFHVDDPYYWSTNLDSFMIGDQAFLSRDGEGTDDGDSDGAAAAQPKAIVDTGTTFFTAETRLFSQIMERLPTVPCREVNADTHPPITFKLIRVDGEVRDFTLSHDQYMTDQGDGSDSDLCAPAFMKIDIPRKHGPAMVLGEVFLRHYFCVFDRGTTTKPEDVKNARLGFAKARHGEDVTLHLHDLTPDQPSFDLARHKGVDGDQAAGGD